jgi:hypothetical protein
MIGYLNITGLEVALLLNFKNAKLEWKRLVNERNRKDMPGEGRDKNKKRRTFTGPPFIIVTG